MDSGNSEAYKTETGAWKRSAFLGIQIMTEMKDKKDKHDQRENDKHEAREKSLQVETHTEKDILQSTSESRFGDFCLKPEIQQVIDENCAFQHPTTVQKQCIPLAISSKDFLCQAKSGTGKTTALVLGSLHKIQSVDKNITTVVLCHTKEKVLATKKEYLRFCKFNKNIKVLVCFRGAPLNEDEHQFGKYPHILVSTVGSFLNLIKTKKVSIQHVKQFIFNDCREVFQSVTDRKQIKEIYLEAPKKIETMMFCESIDHLEYCKDLMQDPAILCNESENKRRVRKVKGTRWECAEDSASARDEATTSGAGMPPVHDDDSCGSTASSHASSSSDSIDWDFSSTRIEVKCRNSYMLGHMLTDLKRRHAEEKNEQEQQQEDGEPATKRQNTDFHSEPSSSSATSSSATVAESAAATVSAPQNDESNPPQAQPSSYYNRPYYRSNNNRGSNYGNRAERRERMRCFKRKISHGNQITELFEAIGEGESEKVADILKTLKGNLNPNCRDLDIALALAVMQENLFMVQNLIHNGATINTWILCGPNGKHCFHYAAEHGFVEIVDLLALEFRSVINTIDEDGNTALILCQNSHDSAIITSILLRHKAKIDVQNNSGETPLMSAIQHQHITSVMHLAKAGADVNLQNQRGITAKSLAHCVGMGPLLHALAEESCYSEADLSRSIAGPTTTQPVQQTASQNLIESFYCALWMGHDEKIPNMLSTIPADELDFSKAMCVAVEAGKLSVYECLKAALPEKFNELVVKENGVKWLSLACIGENVSIVESLLKAGVSVKMCDSNDGYPLVYSLSVSISELLLQHGALPDTISAYHAGYYGADTALKRAVINNNIDMVKTLREYNATVDTSLIFLVLRHGQCYDDMKKLIISYTKEIDVNEADDYGRTGLIVAAQKSDLELVRELIKVGADVNYADENNNTALMMAAKSDDGTIISLLVEKGANLNSQNLEGQTALFIASELNNYDGFCSLIDAGADVNIECGNRTLLSKLLLEISSKRKPEFILYLIQNGGKFTQYECNYAVQRCILMREWDVLYALVHVTRVPPTVLNHRSLYCMLKRYHYQVFQGVMSPVCMAVLCGYVTLAQDMMASLYITESDLNLLPFHEKVRDHLNFRQSDTSLALLDHLASNPPSLLQLTFAKVSDSVGAEEGRRDRVAQLGLPGKLQRALMFELPDQCVGDKHFEGLDCETQDESYEADWDITERERRHRENQGLLWFGWVGRHVPHVYSPDSYNLPDN